MSWSAFLWITNLDCIPVYTSVWKCIYCNYRSQAHIASDKRVAQNKSEYGSVARIRLHLTTLKLKLQRCWESMCSVQLSCLRHICLALIVALNTLIFCNVALNTLIFCKVEAGASILPDCSCSGSYTKGCTIFLLTGSQP